MFSSEVEMSNSVDEMSVFIWTEVFNCGELSTILTLSYLAHNSHPIHVFGYPEDLKFLPKSERIIPCGVTNTQLDLDCEWLDQTKPPNESWIRDGYSHGHLGTARLWAYLIKNRKEDFLLHVDSDLVFVGDAVDQLVEILTPDLAAAGARRMYFNNLNGIPGLDKQADCIDTLCFVFRRDFVPRRTLKGLVRKIRGRTRFDRIRNRKIIDFFDSVTFALAKKGKLVFMDSPEQGAQGFRDANSAFLSKIIEVRSAVGTGCALKKGVPSSAPDSYKTYALESYAIYTHFLLDPTTPLPEGVDEYLENRMKNLNRSTWTISY